LGYQTTLPEVEAMIERPDADHSGTVSLREFLDLVSKRVPAQKRDYE
jgi:Ca2+-binding EF-hand superfamily protein